MLYLRKILPKRVTRGSLREVCSKSSSSWPLYPFSERMVLNLKHMMGLLFTPQRSCL